MLKRFFEWLCPRTPGWPLPADKDPRISIRISLIDDEIDRRLRKWMEHEMRPGGMLRKIK